MQVPSLVGELRSRSREPRSREGHAATAEPVCPSERIHGQGRKPHVPPRRPDTATLAGSRALGCVCAHGSAGGGSCQPRSTLPAGDPGHLCWGDQPGGARSCVLRKHLEDSAKKRRRRLSPRGL
uniref:Uncharacterized protein n=1 Tax=Rangifer tarandus platyrhynchus TaxID=3082113 RepID=A0ACB0ETJ6_RANTA|nr:unnamed protein product [Rangifer tarandus platyrhynchus]